MSKISELDIKLDNALFADIEKAEIEKAKAFKRAIKAEQELAAVKIELGYQQNVTALFRKENDLVISALKQRNNDLLKEIREKYNSEAILYLEVNASLLENTPGSIIKRIIGALFYFRTQKREIDTAIQIAQSGLFDAYWYLTQYPDVAASMMNPILHYMRHGRADKRNPSTKFNSNWYISTYLAEEDSSINPLVHYIEVGKLKGYKIR